ncbi:MAG: hypothetical protein WC458_02815 [Patescibacteria group bacterium]|jgi:hypothetical protein
MCQYLIKSSEISLPVDDGLGFDFVYKRAQNLLTVFPGIVIFFIDDDDRLKVCDTQVSPIGGIIGFSRYAELWRKASHEHKWRQSGQKAKRCLKIKVTKN